MSTADIDTAAASIDIESSSIDKFINESNVKQLSDGNLQFAIDLYKAILNENDDNNLFCSPFSITAALAMTYAGARGQTAEEMKLCMKLDAVEDVHLAVKDILTSLNLGSKVTITDDVDDYKKLPFILQCANRMYVQENYGVTESYVGTLTEHYGTRPETVNFRENAEQTRQQINTWVAEVTRDKIKDLIAPGVIDTVTRLVLVNAIYFKGTWSKQFDPKKTKDEDFFVANDNKTKVKMMYLKKKFPYGESEYLKCKILEMPYEGDRLVMYVLLPDEIEGLTALERQLDPSMFKKLRSKLTHGGDVIVGIPKFRLESTVSLSDTLKRMGIRDLFSSQEADLSGIIGSRELYVSAVIHKAFVEVNEEGTEAAAATAVIMTRCLASFFKPHEFVANHPFLFAIYDKHTDLVLFLGRFKRPVD